MMKKITIGSVEIPLDAYATSGTAILGIKGAGKTYTTKGIAEQLLNHGVPIVVFDAIGVWRYLKVPGKGPGYKVVVAGGKEPDLPLTPDSAPEIVRAAMRANIPLIIDLYDKHLSKADWRRIVQSCFRTMLYENEGVRHIILEEAPEYVPQKIIDGVTYAEVEKLVRMGGNASLGITLVSQRAQEVNKAVLDLCENVILMRQRGANAIDNLQKWTERLSPNLSKKIAEVMPNMKAGEAWIFTAEDNEPVLTRSKEIDSFHPDRKNPLANKAIGVATDTAQFVAQLGALLPAMKSEAEANDPKLLRKRIAELEHQLKNGAGFTQQEYAADIDEARQAAHHEGYKRARDEYEKTMIGYSAELQRILSAAAETLNKAATQSAMTPILAPAPLSRLPLPAPVSPSPMAKMFTTELAKANVQAQRAFSPTPASPTARKILDVIHGMYPVWISFDAAARRAGVSKASSAYRKYVKEVVNSGEVEGQDGKLRSLPPFAKGGPIDGNEGVNAWISRLPPSYGNMLKAIADHGGGRGISKDRIAEHAGISPTSSGLGSGLRELRRLELVDETNGLYTLAEGLR